MEEKMYRLKQSYVGIIENGIKDSRNDEECEDLSDNKNCQHLLQLLRDAHKEDSKRIPLFERCEGCHEDEYGFVHDWQNETTMQHYLCRLLSTYYEDKLHDHDSHMNRWNRYILENKEKLQRGQFDVKVLKPMVRGGIPSHCRKLVWKWLLTLPPVSCVAPTGCLS
jgi:hypothetical protein